MKYKRRESVVEAEQWWGYQWWGWGGDPRVELRSQGWAVATPEGWREVNPGDWILKDGSGHVWPMTDREFKLLYEPA
ncbi:hypothetical protein J2793_007272 [Paraburkholderia caledonica]|uniref:Uncharacterized protein n=1 Tax=Paraburkholderia caledonica TaxID=134536 RepID=A0AB73IUS8_9BURK|nr:hypothetical protein [Paraburkholderia caledonica]